MDFVSPRPSVLLEVKPRGTLSRRETKLGVFRILVPRGRAPVGQHQESRPLARSNDIPVLNGFVNTID